MLTLGNLFILMLLAAGAAWLWHGHGIRERALTPVSYTHLTLPTTPYV